MDRAIRRMWMSAACVFVLLMGTLSYIQFFDSKTLMNNQWNSRALYDNYGSARGSIVVDGTEIASSVKSDDEYNYQRVYNHPLKYAALTGYFSTIYGATGLEAAMDKELAGTSDRTRRPVRFWRWLLRRPMTRIFCRLIRALRFWRIIRR